MQATGDQVATLPAFIASMGEPMQSGLGFVDVMHDDNESEGQPEGSADEIGVTESNQLEILA